jgi:hypothetical protein
MPIGYVIIMTFITLGNAYNINYNIGWLQLDIFAIVCV